MSIKRDPTTRHAFMSKTGPIRRRSLERIVGALWRQRFVERRLDTLKDRLVSLRREGVTIIAMVMAGVNFEVHLTPNASRELHLGA